MSRLDHSAMTAPYTPNPRRLRPVPVWSAAAGAFVVREPGPSHARRIWTRVAVCAVVMFVPAAVYLVVWWINWGAFWFG